MPLDVDSATLNRLLELQGEDTAITRLAQRRDSLPEARRLAELNERLTELNSDISIAQKQNDEIAREQDRVESEMSLLDQKIKREENRLFSGSVSNPRELSSLQAEVEMLKRKKAGLEDDLLEIMVQRDQARETLQKLQSEGAEVQSSAEQLDATVAGLTQEIHADLEKHTTKRDEISASIPEEVVKLYEQLRAAKGGVGAAALVDGTCEGCHTKLPAKEVERLRSEGGLQRCDNCRRILVVS